MSLRAGKLYHGTKTSDLLKSISPIIIHAVGSTRIHVHYLGVPLDGNYHPSLDVAVGLRYGA